MTTSVQLSLLSPVHATSLSLSFAPDILASPVSDCFVLPVKPDDAIGSRGLTKRSTVTFSGCVAARQPRMIWPKGCSATLAAASVSRASEYDVA